jgi:hypothetical protein
MSDPIKGSEGGVYIGGTSTAMTAEPCTDLGAHTVYQVTAATKQVLDPSVAIVPIVNGSDYTGDPVTVDYNVGKITFPEALQAEDVVTLDGNYMPLCEVGLARGLSISPDHEEADVAVFGDTGPRKMTTRVGLKIGVEELHSPSEDLEGATGTTTVAAIATAGAAVFVKAKRSTGKYICGWFTPRVTVESKVTDVLVTKIEFEAVEKGGVVPASIG